jgi:Ca-activated chloride channel family protein
MSFGSLHYLAPVVAGAVAVLVAFAFYLWWKRSVMRRMASNRALRALLIKGDGRVAIAKHAMIALAIVIFAFTLLRPQWGEYPREASSEGVDLLVALDVSRSMLARDVHPSRLERAKDAVRIMAQSLRGNRMGLVLFAGDAFIQCPLTGDIGALEMFLDASDPSAIERQGTNIGAAFDMAYRVFNRRRMTSRNLVLITDGEDHEGAVDGAVRKFKDLGVAVFVAAVGRDSGELVPAGGDRGEAGEEYLRDESGGFVRTRRNDSLLRRIASETTGEYIDISESLSGVYRILSRISSQERTRFGSRVVYEKKERYGIFALVLLLLLVAEAILPERRRNR